MVARVIAGLLTCAIACGDGSLDPLPLSIALEASSTTAAPGETVHFVVDAQGGSLLGVSIDFGDDTGNQFATGGARRAHVPFSHAFSVAGVYLVRATATDATAGSRHADVRITVS
jgi:hypothetical protein